MKILVINTTGIGDTVLSTVALHILKRHLEAEVHFLVHKKVYELFLLHNDIDVLHIYSNNPIHSFFLLQRMKKIDFSGVFVFHANSKIFENFLPKLNYRIAWNVQGINLPEYNIYSPDIPYTIHAAERRVKLLEEAGLIFNRYKKHYILDLYKHSKRKEKKGFRIYLEEYYDVPQRAKLIVIHPFAANIYKMWPLENFFRVAEYIIEKYPETYVFFVGTKRERKKLNKHNLFKNERIHIFKDDSLLAVARLIDCANLVICNDSGLMHIGFAMDKKVVSLWGTTDPITIGPYPEKEEFVVIKSPYKCSSCNTKQCKDPICMKKIRTEEVIGACEKILG